ncbi:MAG: glycosyltransferase [Parasphingorhabdus sp.]|uniref:glycosyltransferase n=1 Tax=Parasphingorhabdus sp. TaxID=2709688 RepID=UPI003296B4BA
MNDDQSSSLKSRVGIVAIGRNEGDRLVRCLKSLQPLELNMIYVDSASTDGSPQAATEHGAKVLDLDLTKPFTAARARNEGFAALIAMVPNIDYVQFVDGDCEVEQGWITKAAAYLDENPDISIICGRRRERFPDKSFYNDLCDREWNTPIGQSAACGGDALMRVTTFQSNGGYNGALIAGEEPELCHRIRAAGGKIWRADEPMTIHDAAMHSFRPWWLRAVRSGFGYAQVFWTTRGSDNPLYRREVARSLFWGLILPTIFVIGAFLHPILGIFFLSIFPLQIVRMAAREGLNHSRSWKSAALHIVGKFGELLGIARFIKRLIKGEIGGAIFYK